MSFCIYPVFLALILNRLSVRFFSSCRCTLGFAPYSASLLFGLALVTILAKHPELYPCWLRRVDVKVMFVYELFVSLVIIEVGFCLWNSLENFLFYKIPSFFEEFCLGYGEFYISVVESPIGVSIISNLIAVIILLFVLHVTKVCDLTLLMKKNGIHKFFADIGLTSDMCRHRRECTEGEGDQNDCTDEEDMICPGSGQSNSSDCFRNIYCCSPKMLRSGKKIY